MDRNQRTNLKLVWTAISFAIIAQPGLAANEMKVFGHSVEVAGPINDQRLLVDGNILLKHAIISIEQIDVVGGTGVLIGGASGGGNVCDASPFILSFPAGRPPKVDGPVDECSLGTITIHPQNIEIVHPASPNAPGHRRIWTPTEGFKDAGPIAFKPDAKLGWEALRNHNIAHPIDLYDNKEVGAAIKALTGSDDETFVNGLTLTGESAFDGDTYFGAGCMVHSCAFAGSFVIADISTRKVFIAWKEENSPFMVRPPVKEWPSPFRLRLKQWTQIFK